MTRSVALWTHGITAAASAVGAAVYGIRGLRMSDTSKYKDDCEAGVPGGCSRFEATEWERRADQTIGGVLLLYSVSSLGGLVFLQSTDATRIDPSNRTAASVLYGTSAAVSVATASLFAYTLKLRSDLSDTADDCFEGNCSEIRGSAGDVENSLALPMILTGLSWVLSVSTTFWLEWAEEKQVSLMPALDPHYSGATLTGRF